MAKSKVKIPSLQDLLIKDAYVLDDPIERNIVAHLQTLQHQNKRLKDHIEKTGSWATLKEIDVWKPFDFYHYFCTKYFERYGTEYRDCGNIVLCYHQIDEFRTSLKISRKDYKLFIEKAFEKYFNKVNRPKVSHIWSARLYNHLMGKSQQFSSTDEFRKLDRDLLLENEAFEEHVREFNQGY